MDLFIFAKESQFNQVPNGTLNTALYKRTQKYRPFPEFRSTLKKLISQEPPEEQPRIERLLFPEDFRWEKRIEARVNQEQARETRAELKAQEKAQALPDAAKAAHAVIASVERAELKEVLDYNNHSSLYQLFRRFLTDSMFQAEIKKHPQVLKLVEPIWIRKSLGASGQAALDLFNLAKKLAKDPNITELPIGGQYDQLHRRAFQYRRYPEFQSTLRQMISQEPPEDQVRIERLLWPKH
jgi:hypothetical protein